MRYILSDGYEETYYQDGSVQKIDNNGVISTEGIDGVKKIKYPDGKEEIILPNDEEKYENNIYNNNMDNIGLGSKNDMEFSNTEKKNFGKNNGEDNMYEFEDNNNDNNISEKNNDDNKNIISEE